VKSSSSVPPTEVVDLYSRTLWWRRANFALRYCPQAKRFYERKKSKSNRVLALKALAHKLARACYYILRNQEPFDVSRCFG